jgi:hypothetical protein
MRQFCGMSMLIKKKCIVCNKPGAPMCACKCVCFCKGECETRGRDEHEKLCKLAQASTVTVTTDGETVQLC